MPDLLFLAQRIPYPPNKGDKIRSYNVLAHLARSHRVHLGCFVDDAADWPHTEPLEAICADTHFAGLDRRAAQVRCLGGLATGAPLSVPYYRDGGLDGWVRDVMERVRPAATFVFSSAMAQYVLDPARRPGRMIMDFVDVDSDKWRQYAATKRWPMSGIYRREARQLLAYDRRVAEIADASVFVSEPEAALFRTLAPESASTVHAVGNGIDAEFFSPDHAFAKPDETGAPLLTFTGAMDYWPNVDAVTWFADDVFPAVRERFPGATFCIVGGGPTPDVMRLAERAGIVVTGRVADVRPYLAHAAAAVVPMRIARGVQNKVLEAMAMARPVVTTPQGLEGIDAEPEREVLLADGAADVADAVARILDGRVDGGIGAAARRRIVADFSWAAKLDAFDRLIEGDRGSVDARDRPAGFADPTA